MSFIRLMLFVAPAAKDAVEQAALAGGLIDQECIDHCNAAGVPVELGMARFPGEEDITVHPPVVPPAEYYYAGWQDEEAKMLRVVEVLGSIPGVEIFRGTAEGVENKATEIDDHTVQPTLLHRMSYRAATEIGKARVTAIQGELELAALHAAIDEAERAEEEAARRAAEEEAAEIARITAEEAERLELEALVHEAASLLRSETETDMPPDPGTTDPSDLEDISL